MGFKNRRVTDEMLRKLQIHQLKGMFLGQLRTKKVKRKDSWLEVKSSSEKTKRKGQRAGRVSMVMEKPPTLPNFPREEAHQFTWSQVFSLTRVLFKTNVKRKSTLALPSPTSSKKALRAFGQRTDFSIIIKS